MLALAYDAALRREELCSLRTDDLDPAHRTLRIRRRRRRTGSSELRLYSAATGVLLSGYVVHRASLSKSRGPLFLLGVPPQSRATIEPVDLIEGGAPDCLGRRCSKIFHPHNPAPVSDRSGPDGLGIAYDRDIRRASPY